MRRMNDSAAATGPTSRSIATRAVHVAYGVAVCLLFTALALSTLLAILLLPGLERRRSTTHAAANLFLRLAGLTPQISGIERLPTGQCVVIANHASYLDGVIMKAVLPPRFAFVVKREADAFPLAGLLLRRIGTEFVERFNRHRGALDARRVLRSASGGQPLVFFPEGTFIREPGLLKFHTGAFATAIRAGCPVVPVVIHGSRAVLPAERILPRPGPLAVEFLESQHADESAGEPDAIELRDRCRCMILGRLDEPDLAA
jgi:1-acyl-sn-glycerol-3-phosphate acyltransferase